MSEQIPILQSSLALGWLQKAFERWRDKYMLFATILALILAAPLSFGSLTLTIYRTGLEPYQMRIFLWALFGLSAVSGLLVFLNAQILTSNTRQALRRDDGDEASSLLTLQQRTLAWQEVALLPNRVVWAVSATLVLTYILPMAFIMRKYARTSSDETIYITLALLLTGLGLIVSAHLIFKFFMMPVYNFLAPTQHDLALSQITTTRMSNHLIFQSTVISMVVLLIFGPQSYYQISQILYRGAFYAYPMPLIRRDLLIASASALALSLFYAALMSYVTSTPARYITQAIAKIQQGEMQLRAPVIASDEIGQIAIYINRLLDQVQALNATLNQEVEERTGELSKRTRELQAITEIVEKAATFSNVNDLVENLVQVIPEYFPFYHVGLFTIDERNGYAVLQASNSPGGQKMLARGHRLRLGEGIVGTVAQQRKARIALDVGADAVFFQNPDLPETRSEMALPMQARGRIIGVLDIQSTEPDAFNYEDAETLQTLANQVALAIENTRLLEESQQALHELRTAVSTELQERWRAQTGGQNYAITFTGLGYKSGALNTSGEQSGYVLEIPIQIQEVRLGTLKLRRTHRPWHSSEREIAAQISRQIGLALENARLLNATREFAEREKTIEQIAASMRQSLDLDAVLRTTANELQRKLGLEEAEIRLVAPARQESEERG